ncbi:MAG: PDZ domain-containing protein [Candidatus Anammoxibacter sp.]
MTNGVQTMNAMLKRFFILNVLTIVTIISGCASYKADDNKGVIIGKANKVNGILINEVPKGGPAEKAGIQSGDIIVSYDGKKIADMENLDKEIAESPPGKKVILEVIRNDALFNVSITFKKKGFQIVNVDPTNEFPNYAINLIENLLWIGTYPYPVELGLSERMLLLFNVFDPDHLPDSPTLFSITVR